MGRDCLRCFPFVFIGVKSCSSSSHFYYLCSMATRQIVTFSFLICLLQLVVSMVLPNYCALCFTRLIIGWFRVWGRFCQFLKMASRNTKTAIYSLASKYTPGLPKPAPVLNNIYVGNLKTELSGIFDTGASDAYGRCQDYRYSGPRCRGSSQGSHLFLVLLRI